MSKLPRPTGKDLIGAIELGSGPSSRKNKAMPKTSRPGPSADKIAEMASRGEDVSAFFTNTFVVVRPDKRVSVDTGRGRVRPKQKSG